MKSVAWSFAKVLHLQVPGPILAMDLQPTREASGNLTSSKLKVLKKRRIGSVTDWNKASVLEGCVDWDTNLNNRAELPDWEMDAAMQKQLASSSWVQQDAIMVLKRKKAHICFWANLTDAQMSCLYSSGSMKWLICLWQLCKAHCNDSLQINS